MAEPRSVLKTTAMPDAVSRATDLRPLQLLYLVIFVAFIGYAPMGTFFVLMLVHNHRFLPSG